MKKFFALLMCAIMLCMSMTSAMAATISGTLTSTTTLKNVTPSVVSVGNSWVAAFNGASASKRVVARVHSSSAAASATWVYSGYSGTAHPYKDEYLGGGYVVVLRARVDDRDEGPITISGSFAP